MDATFYSKNRAKLSEKLNDGIVVVTAFTKMQGTADDAAPFEQEANFKWLSGITAPDWQLIIDGQSGKSWLVAPIVNESRQLFNGSLTSEQARRASGVDGILNHDEATDLLRNLADTGNGPVYTIGESRYEKHADFVLNPAPKKLRQALKKTFAVVHDCRKELSQLRAIKEPIEVEHMDKAAVITADAFRSIRSKLTSLAYEYEVEAELGYYFRRKGATHAFEPIVAVGKNACTLHYTENSASLQKGTLVLIDAGARLNGYPADVTRTFAVHEPTKRQAAVHEAVRIAERQIIGLLGPGVTIREYVDRTDTIMKQALLSLGLIKNPKDDDEYRKYFPHAVSHGLGIDVHESLGGYEELRPGMVLTVEPGIYIPEEGIGVRIEDDVLITSDGHRNLTYELSTDL